MAAALSAHPKVLVVRAMAYTNLGKTLPTYTANSLHTVFKHKFELRFSQNSAQSKFWVPVRRHIAQSETLGSLYLLHRDITYTCTHCELTNRGNTPWGASKLKYENPTIFSVAKAKVEQHPGRHWYETNGKRGLDIMLSLALLPILIPVIATLVLMSKRDGGPGLFGHTRVGQHGKAFKCWKIRTMVIDAEFKLAACLAADPAAAVEWARTQKLHNDPRITPLGRFLRRTSLDELPQIWNVLKGEMSLVGPRPIVDNEVERYGAHKHVYLNLKPGVTGLWQVAGRSNGCYDERLRMDRAYASEISLGRDISLIARTALVVVRPTGT